MALPLALLRPFLEPSGFQLALLITADEASSLAGLGDLAQRVTDGLVPPHQPEVVAIRQPDGGYPPVAVCVPITPYDATLLRAGDLVTVRDIVSALEDAYDDFLAQARVGRFT